VLSQCLAEAGVPYVLAAQTSDKEATFRERPLLSAPFALPLERIARTEVDGLTAQGWLSHAPGSPAAATGQPVKLGVLVEDAPAFRDVYDRVLAPAYAAAGVPVSEVVYVATEADVDSAVLRFSTRGVTHVTFLTVGGLTPGLFMVRATGQRYEPRYGFSSQDVPQVVLPNLPDPKGQLRGALGVGWIPIGDVVDGTDPGTAPPSFQRCLDTMAEHGVDSEDANSAGLLAFTCDGWWFLDTALEAGGAASLSAQSFLAGEESLGETYLPATTHSTRFGPGRHAGVGSIRHFAFLEDCVCFRYTSDKIGV
jgi:hypothetical protein